MNELALFAGGGGGILGGRLLGWRTVCAVELAAYPRSVLLARQRDGHLEPFPIWDDVCTFDGKPWRGHVDIITGGFPCQDISVAGGGAGLDGERSGLWREMARTIGEVGPRYVFVENSPALTSRGLGVVLGDLAAMGFDAEWGVLGADDAGAPHIRKRIWILAAHPDRVRELQPQGGERDEWGWTGGPGEDGDALRAGLQIPGAEPARAHGQHCGGMPTAAGWWAAEPDVVRMVHGVAGRVDRIKTLGNGQVPAVVALAWRVLSARMRDNGRMSGGRSVK